MLRPKGSVQVYLYAEPVDMRKSIDGLSVLVEQEMTLSPSMEALFVFCNRGRDKIKLLCWERNGFIVWYKRLEKQRFRWPKSDDTLSLAGQELFNEAELSVVVEAYLSESETEQVQTEPKAPKARPGRKPLPADLPRVRIEHYLSESEKPCPCGHERTEIGETSSEQLDIIPAKIRVLVNVRKKYACPVCEDGVQTALLPPQPIPKSNASPGLLAHIATAKYQDALPLNRQEAVLMRSSIEIPRNTLASWMIKAGELIQPLLNLLEDKMLAYPVLHCDETSVQALKEPDKAAVSKSYMWVRVGGPPTQPVRLFHYADSRRGEVASQLLAGYDGYLQTDVQRCGYE